MSRQGVLVGGIAVLVLILVVLVGALLLGRQASDVGSGEAAPTVGASTSSSPTPAQTRQQVADVRCWNGRSATSRAACPPVRGVAGVRWAFPTLARDFGRCDPAAAYDGKVRAIGCTMSARGYSARVVYSEWGTFRLGADHYREKYGRPDRRDAQFNIWSTAQMAQNFQTSRMFAGGLPFSVTVAAGSEAAATTVMDALRFRPVTQTRQYR